MARIILTRKSSGGRCCFFRGKGGRMTSTRGNNTQTTGAQQQKGVKDIMNQTSEPSPHAPIAMMENKKTPSNYNVKQSKTNFDNLTKKLSSMKVTPRNISFSV